MHILYIRIHTMCFPILSNFKYFFKSLSRSCSFYFAMAVHQTTHYDGKSFICSRNMASSFRLQFHFKSTSITNKHEKDSCNQGLKSVSSWASEMFLLVRQSWRKKTGTVIHGHKKHNLRKKNTKRFCLHLHQELSFVILFRFFWLRNYCEESLFLSVVKW